ncbi:DUF3830 family protein [Sphingomonas sp.]|uniref:DUF3830 family protein n=1 Tax=Sphingomonas sp. TaxID=28214 RepID=UPI003B3A87F3
MTDDAKGPAELCDPAQRTVLFSEAQSGLHARATLLDTLAPASAGLLWDLAGTGLSFSAIHAMWTGPEISLPIDGAKALPGQDLRAISVENATSYPQAGDIALVCAPRGTWRDGPSFDLVDVGLFYAAGGRLLMPMGWIMANICARIVDEDLAAAAAACRTIRINGGCAITITRGA